MATPPDLPVRTPTLERVRALGPAIREIVERHGARNPRVFGSVARGEERAGSDIDILVNNVRLSLLRLFRLEDELETLLGMPVDVVLEEEVPQKTRERFMAGVVPL